MLYGLEAFDWTLANHEAKMVLYHFTRNLAENGLIDKKMDIFFSEAFKEYRGSHAAFKDGFRKGQAGAAKMALVARHIGRRFPERVPVLIEQLQPVWPHSETHDYWEKFVELHGAFSNIEVLRVDANGLNIVTFAGTEPVADLQLKLGDGFCFRVDSPVKGQAFAMQSLNGAWFKLPLSPESAIISIDRGQQIIPTDPETGKPFPYNEEYNTGRHKFVFVIAANPQLAACVDELSVSEPIDRTELKELAHDFANLDGEWAMFQINVLFVN